MTFDPATAAATLAACAIAAICTGAYLEYRVLAPMRATNEALRQQITGLRTANARLTRAAEVAEARHLDLAHTYDQRIQQEQDRRGRETLSARPLHDDPVAAIYHQASRGGLVLRSHVFDVAVNLPDPLTSRGMEWTSSPEEAARRTRQALVGSVATAIVESDAAMWYAAPYVPRDGAWPQIRATIAVWAPDLKLSERGAADLFGNAGLQQALLAASPYPVAP